MSDSPSDLRALVEQKRSLCNRLAASGANLPAPFTAEEALAILDALAGAEKRKWTCPGCRFEFWKPAEPEPHRYPIGVESDFSPTGACPVCGERKISAKVGEAADALEARLSRLQELGHAVLEAAADSPATWRGELADALDAFKAEMDSLRESDR